jgi:DNA helicase-2/ATP-dependent DNA helicase PcrA
MKFVADLHIHSHFSRATSKELDFEHLTRWAQLKGVTVVGTGDIAHPGWLEEMRQKLEPAEEGLFRLKDDFANPIQKEVPKACQGTVRFMLAGEISNIYKKNDKVRKIHNVVFLPSFEAAEKFQTELEKIGNIRSDGRPILGLDSRDLLEIVLDTDPQAHLIPAHIWTPWFALLGSKSGFDTVEECFDDLTPHIFAVETGLSSDPPMNWRLSILDKYTLVSNSDAHSPPKLGREANHFNTELSYPSIFEALKTGDPEKYLGTIEFFPEEGKYHYDGHRKCEISWDPKTTLEHDSICSKCGKPVTVGVMHRVEKLADRDEGQKPDRTHAFKSLIPLPEILSEIYNVGVNSRRVQESYEALLAKLGSELSILEEIPVEEIRKSGGEFLAEGIQRMRNGDVNVAAGYDGEYGVIKVFKDDEIKSFPGQIGFLASQEKKPNRQTQQFSQTPQESITSVETEIPFRISDQKESFWGGARQLKLNISGEKTGKSILSGLNSQQQEAVLCTDQPLIILAGPGTGKTRTLTHRIAYLISEEGVSPQSILAITFTNKAAQEMAQRLEKLLGVEIADQIMIKTFHAFGVMILRKDGRAIGIKPNFAICNDEDRRAILKQISPQLSRRKLNEHIETISEAKNQQFVQNPSEKNQVTFENKIYHAYEGALQKNNLLDLDDLVLRPIQLFEQHLEILRNYQNRFLWISVDEYQDINLAQYRLLRLLTAHQSNLCVIGDADQAVYGFRGADRTFFLRFNQDYPDARTIVLTENYRSIQPILNASVQVIAKSAERNPLDIWSDIVSNTKLDIYQAQTDKAEAEYVVHQIEKMVGGTSYFSWDSGRVDEGDEATGRSFSDFAVLYRISAQSRLLIEAFQRSGIPFQSAGKTPFFEMPEIQEILSFLWLIYNPESGYHREKLAARFKQTNLFLQELTISGSTASVSKLIERVNDFVQAKGSDDNKERLMKQLIEKAALFENRLGEFLQTTILQKETDEFEPRADRVALMTLHSSKGLEFPVVFIVGCEENLIPYRRAGELVDLEEERRLFYVGMTRAQEKLVLISAKKRFLFGKTVQNGTSRFVNDIGSTLKEIKRMEYKKSPKEKKESSQLKLF